MIETGSSATIHTARARVLLVEDNRVSRLVAERLLLRWGYGVQLAAEGLEALKWAALQEYDLILMNLQMPRLDGWATARLIRRLNPHYAQAPIIALSAAHQQGGLSNGPFTDFLEKPYMPEQLQNLLLQHLRPQTPEKKLQLHLKERLMRLSGNDQLFQRQLADIFARNCLELLQDLNSGRLDEPALLSRVLHKHKSSLRLLELYPLEAALQNLQDLLVQDLQNDDILRQRKLAVEQLTHSVLDELAAAEIAG